MSKELSAVLILYLFLVSLVAVILTVTDKVKAKKGGFRISEKVLFLVAIFGGSLAEYITMRLIRHKTLHKRFMLGLPLIMIIQLLLIVFAILTLYST